MNVNVNVRNLVQGGANKSKSTHSMNGDLRSTLTLVLRSSGLSNNQSICWVHVVPEKLFNLHITSLCSKNEDFDVAHASHLRPCALGTTVCISTKICT